MEGDDFVLYLMVKFVVMIVEVIKDVLLRGVVIFDFFFGLGMILLVVDKVGCWCYGVEYELEYIDIVIRWW